MCVFLHQCHPTFIFILFFPPDYILGDVLHQYIKIISVLIFCNMNVSFNLYSIHEYLGF